MENIVFERNYETTEKDDRATAVFERAFSPGGYMEEITKKMASDLLANGRTKVNGLYSEKKDKTYDADVVLIDSNDKYVHFRLDFDGK